MRAPQSGAVAPAGQRSAAVLGALQPPVAAAAAVVWPRWSLQCASQSPAAALPWRRPWRPAAAAAAAALLAVLTQSRLLPELPPTAL